MGDRGELVAGEKFPEEQHLLLVAGGANQRALQENATRNSWRHSGQRTQAKPFSRSPHSRNLPTTSGGFLERRETFRAGVSKKQLLKENQELREENARLRQEIELLRQNMDLLIRRVFGRSSEKMDASQLDLFLLAPENELGKVDASSLEEADPRHEPKARRKVRCRERWPGDLPIVEQIIDPKEVQKAPQDWLLIGAEVSEQLDYEPGRFLRRRLVRRKYVRRGNPEAVPIIAALPPSLQERCVAAPGLLAQIIVSKYCDHVPLYRQEAIFGNRHGVHLLRQNMARWMELAADWLRPIYEHLRAAVRAGGYLQIDETPIRYLSPGHGQTKLGYFWTTLFPGRDVVYHWETSRAAECLKNVL